MGLLSCSQRKKGGRDHQHHYITIIDIITIIATIIIITSITSSAPSSSSSSPSHFCLLFLLFLASPFKRVMRTAQWGSRGLINGSCSRRRRGLTGSEWSAAHVLSLTFNRKHHPRLHPPPGERILLVIDPHKNKTAFQRGGRWLNLKFCTHFTAFV